MTLLLLTMKRRCFHVHARGYVCVGSTSTHCRRLASIQGGQSEGLLAPCALTIGGTARSITLLLGAARTRLAALDTGQSKHCARGIAATLQVALVPSAR